MSGFSTLSLQTIRNKVPFFSSHNGNLTKWNITACACLWKHFSSSSSRAMCSVARGPLISEGNCTTPLFHASVAATHLGACTCTKTFQTSTSMHRQMHAKEIKRQITHWIDRNWDIFLSWMEAWMGLKQFKCGWRPYSDTEMSGEFYQSSQYCSIIISPNYCQSESGSHTD